MAQHTSNSLNVYFGNDSLKKYYDPDQQPPLPLVEIPRHLNLFYEDGVRIYAKMMTMLPAHNVKALPARQILASCVVPGKTEAVVEYSSGSTVISMSILARINHGISDVRAYLSNKTTDAKIKLMQFFGLDITLFGGPSQPEPRDHRGGIFAASEKGCADPRIVNPNQYENDDNWRSHLRYTGPQILKQLPDISVICAGMGTSGTMTGLGTFFKGAKSSVYRLGVCTAAGQRVPGPRSFALMAPVQFPWKEAVDSIEMVAAIESFQLSMELSREGLVCGPSSGFNLQGLQQFLSKRKEEGTLQQLANSDGLIHCVTIFCDLPYQYIDEYFERLGEDAFPEIHNKNLVGVDKYRYDEAWELSLEQVISLWLIGNENEARQAEPKDRIVLDLRNLTDFDKWHVESSKSLPLASLHRGDPSPFTNSELLSQQWNELEELFSGAKGSELVRQLGIVPDKSEVVVLCYDGDTARVATSVLRAKGVTALSVRGGYDALIRDGRTFSPANTQTRWIAEENTDNSDPNAPKRLHEPQNHRRYSVGLVA